MLFVFIGLLFVPLVLKNPLARIRIETEHDLGESNVWRIETPARVSHWGSEQCIRNGLGPSVAGSASAPLWSVWI